MLPPYQEDIRRHHGVSGGARASWETSSPTSGSGYGPSMTREAKTTSRTYTDSEGNVITEVRLNTLKFTMLIIIT